MKHGIYDVRTLKLSSTKGFSFLNGINRKVVPSHVTKIANAVSKKGLLRSVVVAKIDFITGKPENYVVDGQHLYHACMRLGYDIPYIFVEVKNMEDLADTLASLNNSSKSWNIIDYITVWANINKDYVKLNTYFNTYDIELTQLSQILMNLKCDGHNTTGKIIKSGKFKINDDESYAKMLLDFVTDALRIVPRMDRMSNKLFISTYVDFINTQRVYNHEEFLKKLEKNKNKFKTVTQDPQEFLDLIKSIA